MLSLLSLLLAYLTWRFVEKPLRFAVCPRRTVFLLSLSGLLAIVVMGMVLPRIAKEAERSPDEQKIMSFLTYDFQTRARRNRCFLDSATQPPASFTEECRSTQATHPTLLLWGDSHAAALSMGLRALGPNVVQYTSNSCPPILGREFVTAKYCGETNRYVLDEIGRIQPEIVVLDAHWHAYGRSRLSLLGSTILAIKNAAPRSHVVVTGNVPLWPGGLPMFMLKRKATLSDNVTLRLPLYRELQKADEDIRRTAERSGALFVSALDAFCQGETCRVTFPLEGSPSLATYDYGHLTEAGSRVLAAHVLALAERN
jgi:hypothetical protein